jgi:hypothetical protein
MCTEKARDKLGKDYERINLMGASTSIGKYWIGRELN